MEKGKQTCKILKEIRRQIAEANDIALVTSECTHKGDCAGTCPKCEAEVRYLEDQLEKRRSKGRPVRLAGLAAGIGAVLAACEPTAPDELQGDLVTPPPTEENNGGNGQENSGGEEELLGDPAEILYGAFDSLS
ncbi:MAG: hypothetical protein J5939_03270 [Bacteroidales bacterium]|nr:hypothetical protein [Bacteroidales bacterium]